MLTIERSNNTDMDTLMHELAALRSENRTMALRLNSAQRGSKTVRRAAADATMLVMNHEVGDPTGCRAMRAEGMGKRRWAWAVALLRYAGVVSTRNKNFRRGLAWIEMPVNEAISLLDAAANEVGDRRGLARLRKLLKTV